MRPPGRSVRQTGAENGSYPHHPPSAGITLRLAFAQQSPSLESYWHHPLTSPAPAQPVAFMEYQCVPSPPPGTTGQLSPTRKPCNFTALVGQASLKSLPPSQWRPSATFRSPIRRESRCPCLLSQMMNREPTTTPPRATSSR